MLCNHCRHFSSCSTPNIQVVSCELRRLPENVMFSRDLQLGCEDATMPVASFRITEAGENSPLEVGHAR